VARRDTVHTVQMFGGGAGILIAFYVVSGGDTRISSIVADYLFGTCSYQPCILFIIILCYLFPSPLPRMLYASWIFFYFPSLPRGEVKIHTAGKRSHLSRGLGWVWLDLVQDRRNQTPAELIKTLKASDRPATFAFLYLSPLPFPSIPPSHVSSLFTIFCSAESYSGNFFAAIFRYVRWI
jgi:hypothetical protein